MLGEVVPQIFTPFFLEATLKNLVFQIYIWTLIAFMLLANNKESRVFFFLIPLYVMLDPDLGAFFRHIVSFFLFFPFLLGNMLLPSKRTMHQQGHSLKPTIANDFREI